MTSINAPTGIDLMNAAKFAYHQYLVRLIPRWRRRFPHILIDYDIRAATTDDYYVPPKLRERAIFVNIKFSKRGCESMNCYPFHETGPITATTPYGYTQTSDIAHSYAHPACYHLDRAAATREGAENEVQSVELRYASNRCFMMDTFTKMYMNTPYLRTEEHLIKGVDDVPGLNVIRNPDPVLPEKYVGTFNEAYCRRFGRDLINDSCQTRWWESIIGFILGDTIYITFKLLINNVLNELGNFDYRRPSPILPAPPTADSNRILEEWRNVRDPMVDEEFEQKLLTFQCLSDIGLELDTKIVYKAEEGFTYERLPFKTYTARVPNPAAAAGKKNINDRSTFNTSDLDDILAQFIQDHNFLFDIFVNLGFDYLQNNFDNLLKQLNTTLLPRLKTMLLNTSIKVGKRFLTSVWKGNVVSMLNYVAMKTVTAMAKALVRMAMLASSIVGIVLIVFSIIDFVFMFWDPFGYNNMFPPEFPVDMADTFLSSFYDSMGEGRDLIEFLPVFFTDILDEHDFFEMISAAFVWEYTNYLTINSDGQELLWHEEDPVDDFDEVTLVGAALASNAMYTRVQFYAYTERHRAILTAAEQGRSKLTNSVLVFLLLACAGVTWLVPSQYALSSLVIVFILIAVYLMISEPMIYFLGMHEYAKLDPIVWYKFLYK
ncbi:p74 [Leucania separata nucleopolyhedrovirus]|uniref:p74 n=1 Tax=Leucania separata nucleopolyhedrovirus TaxID=1307956 RepID=Q0IL95_NPVLS|nr:p74 [Leucania separata nucleopolyhedrovirus]AAR28788.1 p74 [Leucania separata nucleopolyhedrovirus]